MRRDRTNKLNLEIVPEKTVRTPKVKASQKSSSHLQSCPLSNEEDKKRETSSPRRLTFGWGRHVGESRDSNIRKRIFKKKGVDGDKSNTTPISGKIVLRQQDVQEKKDVQGLLNNVIKETASKLVEIGKSKAKAFVEAFETVISLHNKPSVVTVS
ncbi:hypothetical protein CQW23_04567 [Capsicum baccatum]|uniref:Calmodulin-binding domain-containing protein n=1 Tax=Capsicum baccatum TaxID=33114 RepID=A0A2G2XFG7_CAPBA|nr:hypothetical protein CQW23_04567 [Capsicum baccatum]